MNPTNIKSKPLILVDGSSYLYRAFHAMPPLTNSKGMPTGAVYGVINMLRRLLKDYAPEHIAVVFDAKGKTFRDDLYDKYKATRKAMPDDLVQQIEPTHAIIKALGLPLLMIEGVEADDVIGTLAKQAEHRGMETVISTGDKDLAQLVSTHITLVNTMTNTILNPQSVTEKFGVPPELIIDYLTLIGDTVDNVPGVPQVGPKTAVKWLTEFGSLDNIILHAADMTGKVGQNLRETIPELPLSKALVTIKLDVALDVDMEALKPKNADKAALIELYQTLEFKTWLKEVSAETTASEQNTLQEHDKYKQYDIIFTDASLAHWITECNNASVFAVDTETTSLNYMEATLVGISLATKPGNAAYIPFGHDYANAPTQLTPEYVLQQLKPLLEDTTPKKIGHHIKYDMEVLANAGIALQGIAYDTMLESFILDSSSNQHSMDNLALKHLNWQTIHFEDVAGKGAKQVTFNQVDIATAGKYAAEDADVTLQLHQTLWPELVKQPGLAYVFSQIEMPLIPVLARMERLGVLINATMLEQQTLFLEKRVADIETDIFTLAGKPFNINSPKQLQEILFDDLKLPVLQKTPTGQASTADAVLQELALEYPLPKLIIEYRSLSKLISTYTKRLPEQINPHTGRIHTSYHQTGAATGRLSSSDPNLQNIPIRTMEGRRIRQAFIAPKGHKIISADYSQIELRIMAHMSQDVNLMTAFANDLDIHTATAAEVLGIPLERVTSDERRSAKAINFGLIYGMSAFGLAKQLDIDRHAAQQYIDRYFARYPGVKTYMETTRQQAHAQGFVETLSGRRLYLPGIQSKQIMQQKAAERAAINAPLQGTAADIIKLAMINLDAAIQANNLDMKMIMQVHDELVFEVADQDIEAATHLIREHMMNALILSVPLTVEIGAGDNWDAASS